ncbi:hypothetical protein D3C72_1364390 [compost metagenome]
MGSHADTDHHQNGGDQALVTRARPVQRHQPGRAEHQAQDVGQVLFPAVDHALPHEQREAHHAQQGAHEARQVALVALQLVDHEIRERGLHEREAQAHQRCSAHQHQEGAVVQRGPQGLAHRLPHCGGIGIHRPHRLFCHTFCRFAHAPGHHGDGYARDQPETRARQRIARACVRGCAHQHGHENAARKKTQQGAH